MFIEKHDKPHRKPLFVHIDAYEADVKEASHYNFRIGAALGGFVILVFWIIYELQWNSRKPKYF